MDKKQQAYILKCFQTYLLLSLNPGSNEIGNFEAHYAIRQRSACPVATDGIVEITIMLLEVVYSISTEKVNLRNLLAFALF